MRALWGIAATLVLSACTTRSAPAEPYPVERVELESHIVMAPTEPTPALVPATRGACPPAYVPREGVCAHQTYVVDDETLARAVAAYKRGAVPPMLGPAAPRASARRAARPLDPGALSKERPDAAAAQGHRLAELDALIALAREKLRERDAASKAKRVEAPPSRAAQVPAAPPAPRAGAVPQAPTGAAPDPGEARMAELSQLLGQLSPEQLSAISSQLGQAGLDARALEPLLRSAQSGRELTPP